MVALHSRHLAAREAGGGAVRTDQAGRHWRVRAAAGLRQSPARLLRVGARRGDERQHFQGEGVRCAKARQAGGGAVRTDQAGRHLRVRAAAGLWRSPACLLQVGARRGDGRRHFQGEGVRCAQAREAGGGAVRTDQAGSHWRVRAAARLRQSPAGLLQVGARRGDERQHFQGEGVRCAKAREAGGGAVRTDQAGCRSPRRSFHQSEVIALPSCQRQACSHQSGGGRGGRGSSSAASTRRSCRRARELERSTVPSRAAELAPRLLGGVRGDGRMRRPTGVADNIQNNVTTVGAWRFGAAHPPDLNSRVGGLTGASSRLSTAVRVWESETQYYWVLTE